ncbi:MAG: cation:proton antiporter, partial [Actinobacteria bacterium]|nr:cation:proton antiporter [Actinomycetota bacterium]
MLLLLAALTSDVLPGLQLSIHAVEVVATAALVVILFDGGVSIGLRRFRAAAVPVISLGVVGTFATAGLVAVFIHAAFGFGWLTAGLLAAAVAPTDPAVMFSVLGDREIEGRTDTILEGESGANDPVGIALMLGLIQLAQHADATFWVVVRVFAEQMAIGLAVGVGGGLLQVFLAHRLVRFAELLPLLLAAAIFGAATIAHGSGFLAVFVAGLLRGDHEREQEADLERWRKLFATASEVTVFVALGLTVNVSSIDLGRWGEGLLIAVFLTLVARPLVGGALLAPVKLELGERLFVIWAGLKGAVPILLAAFAVSGHVHDGRRIYQTVFVVVLASVVVQGSSIPFAARRLGVEATEVEAIEVDAGS